MGPARLDEELPAPLAVGAGTWLLVSGSFEEGATVRRLEVAVDGTAHKAATLDGRFVAFLPIAPLSAPRRAALELVATLADGAERRQQLGELELVPRQAELEAEREHPDAADGGEPMVAICMATHEPPRELFERQVESLRAQTHSNWVCLISDDCSSAAAHDLIRGAVDGDDRFAISRSPSRLGLYRNFERALSMVPPGAELVALCDQDDRWQPQKLSTLVGALGDANLVFSDMRILDEGGRVLSETFWTYKRNNFRNLASLLLDNTVTGAASLFPRRLLDLALPFPPPRGGSYHDHWLAGVALATGRITYVDRPLYDYVQHGAAATVSHPAALEAAEAPQRPPRLSRRGVGLRLEEGQRAYFDDVCRIAASAKVLELRATGRFAGQLKRRAVRRAARLAEPPEPIAWLALRLLRPRFGLDETMWFERWLLKGVIWRRVAAIRTRLGGRRRRPPSAESEAG